MIYKILYGLFVLVYGVSFATILNVFSSLNAITYLAWMLGPQILCMLIYWLCVYAKRPNLKQQKLVIGINALMYIAYVNLVGFFVKDLGGIITVIQNSGELVNNGIEVSVDQSPFFSMLLAVVVLAVIQYAIGKLVTGKTSEIMG